MEWGMKNKLADQTGMRAALKVALVALICAMAAGNAVAVADPMESVALVNGESVTCDEVKFFFQHNRSKVYQHFHQAHGVKDFDGFWENGTRIGEESPLRMLKELTMRDIILAKVQLQLAREEGLIRDSSISSIMNLRKQENQRREKALQSGHVIYGPREYSEPVFFDYFITNLVIRLKQRLGDQAYEVLVSRRTSQAEVRILPACELMPVEW